VHENIGLGLDLEKVLFTPLVPTYRKEAEENAV